MTKTTFGRRSFLKRATIVTAGGIVTSSAILPTGPSLGQGVPGNSQYGVKALFFDMFGTLLGICEQLGGEVELGRAQAAAHDPPQSTRAPADREDDAWLRRVEAVEKPLDLGACRVHRLLAGRVAGEQAARQAA